MTSDEIIAKLPYSQPFLFVDQITTVSEDGITGYYILDGRHDFYKGHFADNPVTPGVILTEIAAQIGLVSLGIYLLQNQINSDIAIALTSVDMEFLKPVYPNEKVTVKSLKKYFRFGKLKCDVSVVNDSGAEVCNGTISGMITSKTGLIA